MTRSALAVLHPYLRSQVDELLCWEPQVRADQPDAVHKMRVATRRLRSALATFKPLFDRELSGHVRLELKWFGGVLAEARDAEVMRDRLADLAAGEPHELGSDDFSAEVRSSMQQRYDDGLTHIVQILDSPRYARLVETLESFVDEPSWADKAHRPAKKVLTKRVDGDWKRLCGLADRVKEVDSAAERDELLHETRKAAKRLRYGCEAVESYFGTPAARLAEAAEKVQEILGDHQDSVTGQQLLRDLASHTRLAADDALIYGRLHFLEQAHAERARAQFGTAFKDVRKARPRRWA